MTFVNSTNGGTWEIDMETFELEWRPYIYANKNRVYKSTNLPFYKFSPTPQELKAYEDEQNEIKRIKEIERKRKLESDRQSWVTELDRRRNQRLQEITKKHETEKQNILKGKLSS